MMDALQKLPESFVGMAVAAALWFGLNYTVLAERAIDKAIAGDVVPSCINGLNAQENSTPLQRLSENLIPDMPGLDLKNMFQGLKNQFRLSPAQKLGICQCAAKRTGQGARFDYALHTASFRLVKPESVGNFRHNTLSVATSQICGALPWLNSGR